MAKTHVNADGINQARMLLIHLYGVGNVFSVQAVMAEEVKEAMKTLTPQELQVKALADKAEDYKQQEKALRARQKIAKAQQKLMKDRKPKLSS